MTIDDKLKITKEIVGKVIEVAGDNPDVKAAGSELAQAARTIATTINNALLPLAAVNFAFEKARKYFAEKFATDLSAKADAIPPDQVVEPKASVAGPALQGLAFSHEESNLKEMYLSLLASAMDGRVSSSVHPAFVDIVRQLTSEEAKFLRGVLGSSSSSAIVALNLSAVEGFTTLYRHLLNLQDTASQTPVENPRLSAYVDNWIRLGLVDVDYTKYVTLEESYDWVEQRPEFVRLKAEREKGTHQVKVQQGIISRTSLGQQFAEAVGITPHRIPGKPVAMSRGAADV